MYNRLLLSCGGGIEPDLQRCSQNGHACVMIGIGGSGIDALMEVKKKTYKYLQPDAAAADSLPQFTRIRFLAIDTDHANTTLKRFDLNEQLLLEAPGLPHILAAPKLIMDDPAYQWMSVEDIHFYGREGTGGIRQLGRYHLIRNYVEIRRRITDMIDGTRACAGYTSNVDIHIFAGLSGGTGSGCFSDICYTVRDIIHEMDMLGSSVNSTIYGYFFLPDLHMQRCGHDMNMAKFMKLNGYAALKELNHFMNLQNPGDYFEQVYDCNNKIKSNDKPVDYCHLISGRRSDGAFPSNPYVYAMDVVSECVLTYLSTNAPGLLPPYPVSRKYIAIGASAAEIPIRYIGTYLASKTYEKIKPSLTRRVDGEKVFDIAKDLGITFDDMRRLVMKGFHYDLVDEDFERPRLLSEDPDACLKDIVSMTYAFEQNKRNAIEVMEENVRVHSEELQTYDYHETRDIAHPTWAVRIFNYFVEMSKDANYGPCFAAELLHGSCGKDLYYAIDGIMVEAYERISYGKQQQQLCLEAICAAAHNYNKALLSKKRYFEEYKCCRKRYLDVCIEKELCIHIIELCTRLKHIIFTIHKMYFQPLNKMLYDLTGIFNDNLNYLDCAEDHLPGCSWNMFAFSDIKAWLDENILNPQTVISEYHYFVDYLVTNYTNWVTPDHDAISKCVNQCMADRFSNILFTPIDSFLCPPQMGQEILNRLQTESIPLWQLNPLHGLLWAGLGNFTVLSIPATSAVLQGAVQNNFVPNRNVQLRGCNRISSVNIVSGIPLSVYEDIRIMKSIYDDSYARGLHLHERDVDWRIALPSPIPAEYDY